MSRREKADIIRDILKLCIEPVGKTTIVYQCNLNFKIVKKYLTWCFINGWIKRTNHNDKTIYTTTELGKSKLNILIESTAITQF